MQLSSGDISLFNDYVSQLLKRFNNEAEYTSKVIFIKEKFDLLLSLKEEASNNNSLENTEPKNNESQKNSKNQVIYYQMMKTE